MSSKTYLISYRINGIKCIDHPVQFIFYDKTINKKTFNFENHNVKGIYGENGSGKSGIITGMQILKNVITGKNYLNNNIVQAKLFELINKKTKHLSIEIEILTTGIKSEIIMLKYGLELVYENKEQEYIIGKEKLQKKNGNSATNKYFPIYSIENGDISFNKDLFKNNELMNKLSDQSRNLLNKTPFIHFIYSLDEKDVTTHNLMGEFLIQEFYLYVLIFYSFVYQFDIYLDDEDDHSTYAFNSLHKDSQNLNSYIEVLQYKKTGLLSRRSSVKKESFDIYMKTVKQLEEFLKLFKPELVSIEVDKKENKNAYDCELILNYGDYKVNAEYESTGIKKLIRLYTRFRNVANGGIAFIDELDSNLHDVYLCKLLEYFMYYTEGQLCFTSHNLGPMNVLKEGKNSIDFLSRDHTIESWTKNGNYSPEKLYQKGMIKDNPFNIDAIDFISIFAENGEL